MLYLVNSISLNMYELGEGPRTMRFLPLREDEAKVLIGQAMSAIGHAELATLLGVRCNRATLNVTPDDKLLVAQYSGPRLEEGSKALPPGAKIEFWLVYERQTRTALSKNAEEEFRRAGLLQHVEEFEEFLGLESYKFQGHKDSEGRESLGRRYKITSPEVDRLLETLKIQ